MPFLVPNVLLLAVPLDDGWVLFAISPPVIGVAGAPFLRTVPAYLAVFRVRGDLLAVIIGGGDGAGIRVHYTPTAPADISMAGRFAHSNGIAVRPYWSLSHPATGDCQAGDLETAIELRMTARSQRTMKMFTSGAMVKQVAPDKIA